MSHTAPKSLSDYRKDIDSALEDSFLRRTLDTFAVAYRANREAVFKEVDERGLIKQIADAKDDACKHMEELYEQFRRVAEERGVHVHRAATAEDANRIIASIARENNVKRIIKSKSMTAEEIQLNPYLEKEGFIVDETDLGEWIIQLRHEGPSHMVMPAIHLSRYQVADDFTKETGVKQDAEDIQRLVKVARVQLRRKFINGDMGISGCNFAVAEMGAVSTVTNEGNARMVTTLPRVHVAIAGLDKLIPNLEVALTALQVLPRNATAQRLTAYVTFMAGAGECRVCEDNKKIMHVVFLDNGRTEIARDPLFSQIFRCVRCGACANVCPVFRLVGGHNRPDPDLLLPRQGQGQGAVPELRGLRILQERLRRRHRPAPPDPRDPLPPDRRAGRWCGRHPAGRRDEEPQDVPQPAQVRQVRPEALHRRHPVPAPPAGHVPWQARLQGPARHRQRGLP